MIYDPHIDFSRRPLVIVGLGGTGAKVAARVGSLLYAMKENGISIPSKVLIIDPDTVEERNVGRQIFLHGDVGEYKAVAVMRYLNAAFGLSTTAITAPVSRRWLYNASMILGCVDNAAARRVIHEYMVKSNGPSCVWIDAGNDRESGQVILGDHFRIEQADIKKKRRASSTPVATNRTHIPIPSLLLPDLIEDAPAELQPAAASCAELVLHWEQDLLINDWISLVMAQYVKKLLLREPVTTFLTYVAANYLVAKSIPVAELSNWISQRIK